MGTEIGAQFGALWRSALLGVCLALLYDALRALRVRQRRRRALGALLDALYVLALTLSCFALALRAGGGELRLYMLAAAAAGGGVSFWLLSPLLRPLWALGAELITLLARLVLLPLRCAAALRKKFHKLCKRLFLFSRNTIIIENYKWSVRRAWRRRR